MRLNNWADFKSICITNKNLSLQYTEHEGSYQILGPDSHGIMWEITLSKFIVDPLDPEQTIENPDVTDFLANVASFCNKAIDQKVLTEPHNCFQMQADAVSGVCTKDAVTIIDYQIANKVGETFIYKYLNGAEVKVFNAVKGDWAQFSIIDIDNVLGYGANTVLKTYVVKKFLFPDFVHKMYASAPGAIPIGVYMRCEYHSVGTEVDPEIFINFDIELKG